MERNQELAQVVLSVAPAPQGLAPNGLADGLKDRRGSISPSVPLPEQRAFQWDGFVAGP